MKSKTSIYHRTFAFAYVLLVAVIFCGCEGNVKSTSTPYILDGGLRVKIFVIEAFANL